MGDAGIGGGGDAGGGDAGGTTAFLCRRLVVFLLKIPATLFFIVIIADRTFATIFARKDISIIAAQNNLRGLYRMHPSWLLLPHPF